MRIPKEVYLFPYDDSTVWADTDESEDSQGVKYIRADIVTEIKAQAIEEVVTECMGTSDDVMVKAKATQMMHYANQLRSKKWVTKRLIA